MGTKAIIFILGCLSVYGCIHAQQAVVYNVPPGTHAPANIIGQTYFYEDISGDTLPFAIIKKQAFVPFPERLLQTAFSKRPLIVNWLKFSIRNPHLTDTLNLVFNCNPHAFVELYPDDTNLPKSMGAGTLWQHLPDKFGKPLMILPCSTNTYYVRIIEKLFYIAPVTAELYSPFGYLSKITLEGENSLYLFLFMCTASGCLLFMAIYASYQWLITKDAALFYYAAYVFCAFIVWLIICDQRFQLQLFERWKYHPHILVSSGIAFFYALFIASMLDIRRQFPKKWDILKVLLVLIFLETLVEIYDNFSGHFLFSSNMYYQHYLHIPNMLMNLYLIYLIIASKSPLKSYLLTGMLSLFLFLFVISHFVFSFTQLPPKIEAFVNFPPFWGMVGVVMEAICFAFALAYRGKLVQKDKDRLQAGYAAELKAALDNRTVEIRQQQSLLESQRLHQAETAFQKKLAETEMTALRAQMNPHFIFNCLNSIKLYTLENDPETASGYLTTFSRLIRLVLDNSRSEKVTLENEIETLRLYIELEVMRFKDKVGFAIAIDGEIDTPYIEVPPLLLQPYVENAIWHGLMHKERGGNVTISISQPVSHLLHVEIIDDGVGRQMAAMYKSKSIARQKSAGIQMTSDRLQVINELYGIKASVSITDLRDSAGHACGTKVIIEIPI